ncbi:5-aminolevulinate synthase [Roseospira marina]|uniref:5-aminolevulinate synthase n=1 Tax=Roseospira marina TaxID=140057 RepID=A0A5M6IB53_9PROT|nr:5-aminolevulinate synthase [Roseospira marina]KAA5604848.1 5-aminolevulinate synthase [Roseospira marina]MBB4315181.1 5-aminolevulinate synthase [Roseospira marina]MBB5088181.1 5-aminolevulinate synthase [Roseospira marina]
MDYQTYFASRLRDLRDEGRYRVFCDLERRTGKFPMAVNHRDGETHDVTIWCSNDYMGMGMNPVVTNAIAEAVQAVGAGAGGTRNISGTTHEHVLLENELASWHGKESSLIFTSGYVANLTTLMTLGQQIPDLVIFSDALNHNSMIEGVRHSRAPKKIFKHNDPKDLDRLLSEYPKDTPKLVAFESVYSMDGDIAPIADICDVAEKHGALTFLDEVHAVGMYGEFGSGVAERDGVADRIDIIQATMGKAIGCIGGYIAGSADMVDFVRSFGAGFIFTTSLPPGIAAGARASIQHLRQHNELRIRHQERAATLKRRLRELNLPVMDSVSHIVPLLVGDATQCKQASDLLLRRHNIYVQPINYPTVPRGTERLRITPTPLHDDALMDQLVAALLDVWSTLEIDQQAA